MCTSMATGNERTVEIHHVDETGSGPGGGGGDGGRPVSVFGWMATAVTGAGSALFHTLTGPAAPPLILACVCAALAYGTKRLRKQKAAHPRLLHRSMSIAFLHGGQVALERILDAQEARVNEVALDGAADRMRQLLEADPKTISYRELHVHSIMTVMPCIDGGDWQTSHFDSNSVAAKLEMGVKEDEAIKMLKKAVEEAQDRKWPHEAHELEMLLVEMLIYKGDYQQALRCKCLADKEISDARGPLYMAIIYTIIGDTRAKGSYEDFREIRGRFHWPDSITEGSPLYGIVHDFDTFVKAVQKLKAEIEYAKTMQK